jgi:hypothetical protein
VRASRVNSHEGRLPPLANRRVVLLGDAAFCAAVKWLRSAVSVMRFMVSIKRRWRSQAGAPSLLALRLALAASRVEGARHLVVVMALTTDRFMNLETLFNFIELFKELNLAEREARIVL